MIYDLARFLEHLYPQTHGCAMFVLSLLGIMIVCISMYSLTKWTEWFVSFIGALLFVLPFLMHFAR